MKKTKYIRLQPELNVTDGNNHDVNKDYNDEHNRNDTDGGNRPVTHYHCSMIAGMPTICGLLLKGRAGLSVQKLLRSVVLMAKTGHWAEGHGMRRVGGLLYCLALQEIFIGFEGRLLLSLQSNKAI